MGLGYIMRAADKKPEDEDDLCLKTIFCFRQLIRYNRRIQSLQLNNCGLNSQILCGFIPALRHARSLLCLHLASNPGIR